MGLWWWDSLIIILFSESFVTNFSEIFRYGVKSVGWNQFGFINFALLFSYLIIYLFTENIIGSFSINPFSVFITFHKLFFNFIVCIFGTVVGYILIIGGSLPEMELLSHIVIECILSSFQWHKLPI